MAPETDDDLIADLEIEEIKVGDLVTVQKKSRRPLILEYQYHVRVVRETSLGYFVASSNAVDPDTGRPTLFGPFKSDQLLPGWYDEAGRPRL
jgi:hypothetical protein